MNKLKTFTWQGVAVLAIIIAGAVAMVALHVPDVAKAIIAILTGLLGLGTTLFAGGDDDEPPPPPTPPAPRGTVAAQGAALALLVLACFLRLLTACGASPKPAEYAAELALCSETRSTCQSYVECRAKVAAKYGREFHGSCKDGGAP